MATPGDWDDIMEEDEGSSMPIPSRVVPSDESTMDNKHTTTVSSSDSQDVITLAPASNSPVQRPKTTVVEQLAVQDAPALDPAAADDGEDMDAELPIHHQLVGVPDSGLKKLTEFVLSEEGTLGEIDRLKTTKIDPNEELPEASSTSDQLVKDATFLQLQAERHFAETRLQKAPNKELKNVWKRREVNMLTRMSKVLSTVLLDQYYTNQLTLRHQAVILKQGEILAKGQEFLKEQTAELKTKVSEIYVSIEKIATAQKQGSPELALFQLMTQNKNCSYFLCLMTSLMCCTSAGWLLGIPYRLKPESPLMVMFNLSHVFNHIRVFLSIPFLWSDGESESIYIRFRSHSPAISNFMDLVFKSTPPSGHHPFVASLVPFFTSSGVFDEALETETICTEVHAMLNTLFSVHTDVKKGARAQPENYGNVATISATMLRYVVDMLNDERRPKIFFMDKLEMECVTSGENVKRFTSAYQGKWFFPLGCRPVDTEEDGLLSSLEQEPVLMVQEKLQLNPHDLNPMQLAISHGNRTFLPRKFYAPLDTQSFLDTSVSLVNKASGFKTSRLMVEGKRGKEGADGKKPPVKAQAITHEYCTKRELEQWQSSFYYTTDGILALDLIERKNVAAYFNANQCVKIPGVALCDKWFDHRIRDFSMRELLDDLYEQVFAVPKGSPTASYHYIWTKRFEMSHASALVMWAEHLSIALGKRVKASSIERALELIAAKIKVDITDEDYNQLLDSAWKEAESGRASTSPLKRKHDAEDEGLQLLLSTAAKAQEEKVQKEKMEKEKMEKEKLEMERVAKEKEKEKEMKEKEMKEKDAEKNLEKKDNNKESKSKLSDKDWTAQFGVDGDEDLDEDLDKEEEIRAVPVTKKIKAPKDLTVSRDLPARETRAKEKEREAKAEKEKAEKEKAEKEKAKKDKAKKKADKDKGKKEKTKKRGRSEDEEEEEEEEGAAPKRPRRMPRKTR